MNIFQQTENFILKLCLWREARGVSPQAMAAILAVIRNRAEDPKKQWPNTMMGVVLQPAQFSSFNANDPNAVKLPNPKNKPDWDAWVVCCNVVDTPLLADPTDGANHYESLGPKDKKPGWCDPNKITCVIGPFRFYKL